MPEILHSLDELARLTPIKRDTHTGGRAGYQLRTTVFKMNLCLSFILDYQRSHQGTTPKRHVIANELGYAAPDGGGTSSVSKLLRKLEEKRLISILDENPLRILVLHPENVMPLDSARRIGAAAKLRNMEGTPQERFDAVQQRRFEMARYIDATWTKMGRGPTLKEMLGEFHPSSAGYINRQLEILAEDRIITHRAGSTVLSKLTEYGEHLLDVAKAKANVNGKEKPLSQLNKDRIERMREANKEIRKTMTMAQFSALRDAKLMELCVDTYAREGRGPSWIEMEAALECGSGSVSRVVDRLRAAGKIDRERIPIKDPKPNITGTISEKGAERDRILYKCIVDTLRTHGRTPKWSEMEAATSTNPGNVKLSLDRLTKAGLIDGDRMPTNPDDLPDAVLEEKTRPIYEPPIDRPVIVVKEYAAPHDRDKIHRDPHNKALAMLRMVHDYTEVHGYAPQHWEIDKVLRPEIANFSVHSAVIYAERNGWIKRDRKKSRSLTLTSAGKAMMKKFTKSTIPKEETEPMVDPNYSAEAERRAFEEARHMRETSKREVFSDDGLAEMKRTREAQDEAAYREAWRREQARMAEPAPHTEPVSLANVDDKDLAFELMMRGYTVRRS